MEFIKENLNKVIIGIVIVFLATFVYNYVKNDEEATVLTEVVTNENIDEDAEQILQTLNKLELINLNSDFFTNDISNGNLVSFSKLEDFTEEEIAKKPIGKNNPFDVSSHFYGEDTGLVSEGIVPGDLFQDENEVDFIIDGGITEVQ